MADALDTTFEISKLIKFLPKSNAMFDKLKRDFVPDCPSFRVLSITRCTMQGESEKCN